MQSCPKNVQAGPLIGIKTSKGPVLATQQQNLQIDTPFTLASATGAISNQKVSCKMENILGNDIVIKPENDNSSIQTDCANKQTTYDKVALAPQPNYSINAQVLEQEHSTSPARGSTGLQLPPVHCEALQPIETNFSDNSSLGNHISSQRKARLGKSKERERQYMIMSGYQPAISIEDFHSSMLKHEVKQETCVKLEKDYEEDVVECIDDSNEVVLEKVKVEKESPTPKPLIDELECRQVTPPRPILDNTIDLDASNDSLGKHKLAMDDDVIDLSDSSSVVHDIPIMKRRKLLEKPPTPKQSPPNSYKRLIKAPTNPPKSYLANSSSKSKLISANMSRISSKVSIKRKNMLKNKRNARLIAKNKKKIPIAKEIHNVIELKNGEIHLEKISAVVKCSDEAKTVECLDKKDSKEVPGDSLSVANIDLTIDRVAKGYFSESEILSKVLKKRLNKKQEKRSHSEATHVPSTPSKKQQKLSKKKLLIESKLKIDEKIAESPSTPTVNNNSNDCEDKNQNKSTKSKAPKAQNNKNIKNKEHKGKKSKPEDPNKTKKLKTKKKLKKLSEKCDTDNLVVDSVITVDDSLKADLPVTPKRKYVKKSATKVGDQPIVIEQQTKETEVPSTNQLINETMAAIEPAKPNKPLLKEADVTNNNDECFEDNNKTSPLFASSTATCLKGIARRSRKSKFGNKKRLKLPSIKELDDFVKPERSSSSNPRWSNGWTWEGEPFKAYVFLNVSFCLIFVSNRYNNVHVVLIFRVTMHRL